jgi:hypothetical protein
MRQFVKAHVWLTLLVSAALVFFFTFSVAFLSHGFLALLVLSSLLILAGVYYAVYYESNKGGTEIKILSLLNMLLVVGFFPGIGMRPMGGGMAGPYIWLSIVTINLFYSIWLILSKNMRMKNIFN